MPLMSYFGLSSAFGNKLHTFPFRLFCELVAEASVSSIMQNGFSGLFV